MITTGIIREVALSKGNFVGNAYRVELNIFQIPGDNDKKNYTFIANCSIAGGLYNSYNVGDLVYVGFLNNNKSLPVILGKIYQGLKDEPRSIANLNALKVSSKVELPKNTTIGNINFLDKEYFFNNVNDVIRDKNLFVDSIQFKTNNNKAGKLDFSDTEGVLNVTLSPDVTMAVGVDAVLKVYNDTNTQLVDGQVVYITDSETEITPVALAIGSNYSQAEKVMGIVTESIDIGKHGFITRRGFVGGLVIDPAIYSVDDAIYLSSTVPGGITRERPVPPNFITKLGYVTKLSSNSSAADGQIYVDVVSVPVAADIIYDNEYITEEDFRLDSKNVQGAIDELQLNKADISMLSSNITLYRTLVDSDIVGYKKLVTSTADSDYPAEATAVSSGAITTTDQYIAGAISPANLFVGNPGQINIFSIGRVRKASGNKNKNAEFFFRIYKRDSGGIETLLATSAVTGVVSSTEWLTFNATALLNNGNFTSTDRIVVKSYANVVGIAGGTFEYEFGGINPFRLLIPVPVSVIPTSVASAIFTDTTNFDKILSHLDINVQHALETIDVHTHILPTASATVAGVVKIGTGLSMTDEVLSVINPGFDSQTKKTFLAAPNATDGVPTFREIIAADIPTLNQDTTGNAETATKLATARTFTITDNDATNSQASATNFDGSANFTVKLPSTIKASLTGTASGNLTSSSSLDTTKLLGTVAIANGGTGTTTAVDAFKALSPMTTVGDMIYAGGDFATGTRLAGNITTTRKFLLSVGNGTQAVAPSWGTLTKTDVGLSNVDNTSDANKPVSTATQTALNNKQATITGGATTITSSNLTASRALVSDASGKVAVSAVTSTELGYVSGVTSSIQTQLGTTVKTSGDQTIAGTKTFSSTITGSVSGNAGTATKLATARTFTITDNDATNSQAAATAFDGLNAYTIKLPATIKASLTGTASGNLTSTSTLDASKLSGAIPATVAQTKWDSAYSHISLTNNPHSVTAAQVGAAAITHDHNYAGSATAGGVANSATKLATKRTIGAGTGVVSTAQDFDGTANITIPITGISESYLTWGGKSLAGQVTPIGMSLSNEHSANRLAFINGNSLYFEYSSDGGTTWTDYGYNASTKTQFCTTSSTVPIGRINGAEEYTTLSRTRITLTAQDGTNTYVYTNPKKMLVNIASSGGMQVLVEYRTGANYQNAGAWSTFGTYTLSGWSGWNDLPLVLETLGGGTTQTGNNWQLRLTFIMTSKNTTYPTAAYVNNIRIYGENAWTTPSTMAATNNLYSFDMSQNALFPAAVQGTRLISTTATGTAPFTVTSTTRVANLNVATAGNADSANKLSNTVKIGDINQPVYFNASGIPVAITGDIANNITGSAASLTTPRTLTIGAAGKTFNGGADVTWSLADIGLVTTFGSTPTDTSFPSTKLVYDTFIELDNKSIDLTSPLSVSGNTLTLKTKDETTYDVPLPNSVSTYAPETAGTAGQLLISTGINNPIWTPELTFSDGKFQIIGSEGSMDFDGTVFNVVSDHDLFYLATNYLTTTYFGTVTEEIRIGGVSANPVVNTRVKFLGTTEATSSDASASFAGGVNISKKLRVVGDITTSGNIIASNTTTQTDTIDFSNFTTPWSYSAPTNKIRKYGNVVMIDFYATVSRGTATPTIPAPSITIPTGFRPSYTMSRVSSLVDGVATDITIDASTGKIDFPITTIQANQSRTFRLYLTYIL